MLASVAGEVAVVAVDHRQAGAHVTREVEGRESGTERESCEGVPEIVDPPQRPNTCSLLGRAPLERAEVVDVEVAASLAGKQQRRAVALPDSIECLEAAGLQRHGPRARLGLRDRSRPRTESSARTAARSPPRVLPVPPTTRRDAALSADGLGCRHRPWRG